MRIAPWKDVGSSDRFPPDSVRIDFYEFAARNPCLTCEASYCCWYLHLQHVRPTVFRDFDYLRYLLNFDGIEVLVTPRGRWGVYLRRPCGNLDSSTGLCTIRGRPEHPHICRTYNPYTCFYKSALSGGDPASKYVRLDRARFERVMTGMRFDTFGSLVRQPSLRRMAELAGKPELQRADSPSEIASPTTPQPISSKPDGIRSGRPESPCSGCSAPCCRLLLFRRRFPRRFVDIDFLRYALGFPGVMAVFGPGTLSLGVKTTCRHFDEEERVCGVFGKPERPKHCEFYDEFKCEWKRGFVTHPALWVRFQGLAEFADFEKLIAYDETGRIRSMPEFARLRARFTAEVQPV